MLTYEQFKNFTFFKNPDNEHFSLLAHELKIKFNSNITYIYKRYGDTVKRYDEYAKKLSYTEETIKMIYQQINIKEKIN